MKASPKCYSSRDGSKWVSSRSKTRLVCMARFRGGFNPPSDRAALSRRQASSCDVQREPQRYDVISWWSKKWRSIQREPKRTRTAARFSRGLTYLRPSRKDHDPVAPVSTLSAKGWCAARVSGLSEPDRSDWPAASPCVPLLSCDRESSIMTVNRAWC